MLHTKIAGVQYYRGEASPGEKVVLRREPTNKYDRNAIAVANVMGQQMGHIPRTIAGKLAPYVVRAKPLLPGACLGAYLDN